MTQVTYEAQYHTVQTIYTYTAALIFAAATRLDNSHRDP